MRFLQGLIGAILVLLLPAFATLHVLGIVNPTVDAGWIVLFYLFLIVLFCFGIMAFNDDSDDKKRNDGQLSGDL